MAEVQSLRRGRPPIACPSICTGLRQSSAGFEELAASLEQEGGESRQAALAAQAAFALAQQEEQESYLQLGTALAVH